MRVWMVVLPALPMAELHPNAYLGSNEHWGQSRLRDDQRDIWLGLLLEAGVSTQPPPQWRYPVDVAVTLTGCGKRADPQSWAMNVGLKVLLDCLTEPLARKRYGLGIIEGDSFRYIREYRVEVDPDGPPETRVTVEETP